MLIIFNGGLGLPESSNVFHHENKLECILNNVGTNSREEEERDLLAIVDKMGVR